jgi:hypothetical protein
MTHLTSTSSKALYTLHACVGGVKAIQIPGTCAAVRHKDDACCTKEPLHEANCTRNSAIKHRMRGSGGQSAPCNLPGTDPSSAFSVLLSSHALAVGQCRQPSRKLKQAEHVKAQEARVRPRCLSLSLISRVQSYFPRHSLRLRPVRIRVAALPPRHSFFGHAPLDSRASAASPELQPWLWQPVPPSTALQDRVRQHSATRA